MPELEALPANTQQEVEKLGSADITVGIASYNNAETIGDVVRTVREGLAQHFPSQRAILINSDGGSKDGTPERVLEASQGRDLLQVSYPIHAVDRLEDPYGGVPGRSNALRTIFLLSQKLGAGSCAVVESDLSSVTPEWIELLLRPTVKEGFDFVTPCFLRHKFEGAILNGIAYPLVRALYGKRIRQPVGVDFGISSRLIERCLAPNVWNNEVVQCGAEIGISMQALCGPFNICQAFLGARTHRSRDPAPDLREILAHVVGGLFTEMATHVNVWQKVRGSHPVPLFGLPFQITADPATVNVKPMIETFRLGSKDLQEIWGMVLPPATLLELQKMGRRPDEEFRFQDQVWVRTLYDFALGHRMRVIGRDHLLGALTPLYSGWVASFILEMQNAGSAEVENRLEKLCLAFEAQKPYLISRWRWPDRFNP